MNKKEIRKTFPQDGVSLTIELDKGQVFEDDPGQGTPAMVTMQKLGGKSSYIASGTYWCAIDSGELSSNGWQLTHEQIGWLSSLHDEIETFLYGKD